ncbi:hypothetical protein IAQ61_001227 [Plenodomus lingam]|uniref:TEA domain-containing protein n=1 Tax=Leptosphaeria maculans (strain JN3 / isolate v23.1.3 / race Av1-4-5-6-7-8) TaxID=985895 RepID=E5A2C4_LEPMJ|nr:hypothetical protein LEMA_P089680.1 [Plenodomus lingam JN3]KAH9880933.1 hypothetical protein IAQ61_001227 [Plenodomus lingam]CBX97559.1 hypothetical protein LEMA_P089680.1 [Plenodomus lingam JN3]
MELQHQQSCVLAADVPASHHTPDEVSSSRNRSALQERSANWPHEYTNTSDSPRLKISRSPSPTENVYARQSLVGGNYFTGNVHAQHNGLVGFGVERPEKQIRYELERLYKMLRRSDKYQKYREKQPVLTPAEFIAREAAEAAEKKAAEQRGAPKDEKEKSVWPEFLEHAFWRALVKWPPMGRKKYMLDSQLRGRNELIQYSIYRDTGIRRCRKQVSSHLQVLKQHLKDQPAVLVYMALKEDDKKRHRVNDSSHAYHTAHLRGRHHPQRTASAAKYGYDTDSPHTWPQFGALPSNLELGAGIGAKSSSSPYEVTDFTMLVEEDDQPVHYFTSLQPNGRSRDLNVRDTVSWRSQYPEFDFLQSEVSHWSQTDRKVLVCDASIKIMTEAIPNANLSITFNLQSQVDLSMFEALECTTRFYDSGDIAPDPQFDGAHAHDLKEHRTPCDYAPDPHGSSGRLRIAFGSRFWVNRMLKYQSLRHKDENCVKRSLLRLTATQDVYGIERGTHKAQCVLTILWRFEQTRSTAEVGSMKWRPVSFNNCQNSLDQKWIKEDHHTAPRLNIADTTTDSMDGLVSLPVENSLYHPSSLPLDPYSTHHFAVQPSHHNQNHNQPQLSLDILASMQQPDLEHHSASAPNTATGTDYSQGSLPSSLCHSQDAIASSSYPHDANDFDFNGGHITISGAFEPSINLGAYDAFGTNAELDGLHALAGLEHDHDSFAGLGLAVGENGELISVPRDDGLGVGVGVGGGVVGIESCYSTKPNWHHSNLISSLENAAESYHQASYHSGHGHNHSHNHNHNHLEATPGHELLRNTNVAAPVPVHSSYPAVHATEDLVAHGLHDAHVNVHSGLWNLASPFHEDTGSGAVGGVMGGAEGGKGSGLGMGVLELIEREQGRGY